jgi:hypothetical protein
MGEWFRQWAMAGTLRSLNDGGFRRLWLVWYSMATVMDWSGRGQWFYEVWAGLREQLLSQIRPLLQIGRWILNLWWQEWRSRYFFVSVLGQVSSLEVSDLDWRAPVILHDELHIKGSLIRGWKIWRLLHHYFMPEIITQSSSE